MSNIRKVQNSFSCPNSKSICNRKRSIYSNNKIGANYSCNYMGHTITESFSSFQDSIPRNCETKNSKQTKRPNVISKGYEIPNHLDIESDSIASAVGLNGSTKPSLRRCEFLEEKSHDPTFEQDYAACLKAFALIYVLPEEEWTAENINRLLLKGEELFQTCSEDDNADGPLRQPNIYNNFEKHIKRKFKLEGHSFTLELKPLYLGAENKPMEQRPPHIISNLKPVLQGFFRTSHYCLLLYKAGFLLIWRRRQIYFVMDVKGRLVNPRNGVVKLICLQTLNNVVHLIRNLSGVSPSDKFSIRELCVVRLVTPDGRVFQRDTKQPSVEYKVINPNYAYLTSHLHLTLNPNAALRNRSSLFVGVAAILASKIDHPASWNTIMFDRLICYGVDFCRNCWGANMEERLSMELDNFPTQLRLGQFVVGLKLVPKVCAGHWQYSGICSKNNNLQEQLLQTLQSHGNALLQINSQTYALWVKDNFYYLLDPYRHTVATPQKRENGTLSAKWATVRMFRDYPTMLSVFHQLLKESNRQSNFSVHVVQIKNIVECPQGYSLKPLPCDANYEVKSLNETIEFPEQLNNCEQLLSKISDYELDVPSETEEEPLIVNRFKLLSDKAQTTEKTEQNCLESITKPIKSTYAKPNILKDVTQASSRSTSPRGKRLGPRINMIPVERRTPVEPKHPQLSLTAIKATTTANDKREMEKYQNGITAMSTRRKGVWSAKATDNLSALRKATCGRNQLELRDSFDLTKKSKGLIFNQNTQRQADKQMLKTVHSQTSFASAKLPSSLSSSNTNPLSLPTARISYPIYTKYPHNLAVAGSESGTVESLTRLLDYAFKVSNRVLTMTPWGNYVVFRHPTPIGNSYLFYLFDGCTCNIDRFRHLDLNTGTAGLLPFKTKGQVICYMIDSREKRAAKMLSASLDDSYRRFEEFLGRSA